MIKKIYIHFIDIIKSPFLLFFLIYKYFYLFFFKKTKKIILEWKILKPSLEKTFIRWWDWETNMALGISFSFEKSSFNLKKYFKYILNYSWDKIILWLPLKFILFDENKTEFIKVWRTTRLFFYLFLDKNKNYWDAFFFRDIWSLDNFKNFYKRKKIFLISNKNTLEKVNWIMNNIIDTYEIPFNNTFKNYKNIKISILKKILKLDKQNLIIMISWGPFAKVLSYDLTIENNFVCHDVWAIFDIYLKN